MEDRAHDCACNSRAPLGVPLVHFLKKNSHVIRTVCYLNHHTPMPNSYASYCIQWAGGIGQFIFLDQSPRMAPLDTQLPMPLVRHELVWAHRTGQFFWTPLTNTWRYLKECAAQCFTCRQWCLAVRNRLPCSEVGCCQRSRDYRGDPHSCKTSNSFAHAAILVHRFHKIL